MSETENEGVESTCPARVGERAREQQEDQARERRRKDKLYILDLGLRESTASSQAMMPFTGSSKGRVQLCPGPVERNESVVRSCEGSRDQTYQKSL